MLVFHPCGLLNATLNQNDIRNNHDIFDAYEGAFDGSPINLYSLTHWYRAEEGRARELNDSRLLSSVQNAVYSFLNDEDSTFGRLRISFLEDAEGELIIDKNEIPLRVSQLSSGEKLLFLLVADLARRMAIATPYSQDPCKEGTGLILIDEIDLHLHPKRQQSVIDKLRATFLKCQFIITTHSPLIVSKIKKIEQICVLKNGKAEHPMESNGRDFTSILLEEMGVYIRPNLYFKEIEQFRERLSMFKEMSHPDKGSLRENIITLWKELKEHWGSEDESIKELEQEYKDTVST